MELRTEAPELKKEIAELLAKHFNQIVIESEGKVWQSVISVVEKSLVLLTLDHCKNNQVKASEILGISRNTLRDRFTKREVITSSPIIIKEEGKEPIADESSQTIQLKTESKKKQLLLKEIVKEAVGKLEKTLITRILTSVQWNRRKAAKNLGISYRALLYKIKEHNIS